MKKHFYFVALALLSFRFTLQASNNEQEEKTLNNDEMSFARAVISGDIFQLINSQTVSSPSSGFSTKKPKEDKQNQATPSQEPSTLSELLSVVAQQSKNNSLNYTNKVPNSSYTHGQQPMQNIPQESAFFTPNTQNSMPTFYGQQALPASYNTLKNQTYTSYRDKKLGSYQPTNPYNTSYHNVYAPLLQNSLSHASSQLQEKTHPILKDQPQSKPRNDPLSSNRKKSKKKKNRAKTKKTSNKKHKTENTPINQEDDFSLYKCINPICSLYSERAESPIFGFQCSQDLDKSERTCSRCKAPVILCENGNEIMEKIVRSQKAQLTTIQVHNDLERASKNQPIQVYPQKNDTPQAGQTYFSIQPQLDYCLQNSAQNGPSHASSQLQEKPHPTLKEQPQSKPGNDDPLLSNRKKSKKKKNRAKTKKTSNKKHKTENTPINQEDDFSLYKCINSDCSLDPEKGENPPSRLECTPKPDKATLKLSKVY